MNLMDRNIVWKEIWTKKGLDKSAPLHHANGYDLLSAEEWERMILQVTKPIGLQGHESILECGCGAGAFLTSLLKIHPGLKVSGVDYSPTLLARARERLNGEFFVADMTDLGFLQSETYDHTASFGVMIYLASEEAARRAVLEMLRVAKPDGVVYIGEISDLAKRDQAENIRRSSHQGVKKLSTANPDHLYLPKELFQDIARSSGIDVRIIDHADFDLGSYQGARYRYSVYFRKQEGKPQ